LKNKEVAWLRDENLSELRNSAMSYFSSVEGDSVVFSYDFLVSLAFFGSFLGSAKKNENINSSRNF